MACSFTVKFRHVLALLALVSAIGVYVWQGSFRYTIRIFSNDVEQWEGWSLLYDLDELQAKYPEFLPFVPKKDSLFHRQHTPANAADLAEEADDWPVFWEDGDGMYSFEEIYRRKTFNNLFEYVPACAVMPQAYIRSDREGYLRPHFGHCLSRGTYYLNQWLPRPGNAMNTGEAKRFRLYGFFIQIEKDGWHIAGHDICCRDIISSGDNGEAERMECHSFVSPLLSFDTKYILRRRDREEPDVVIAVAQDANNDP